MMREVATSGKGAAGEETQKEGHTIWVGITGRLAVTRS